MIFLWLLVIPVLYIFVKLILFFIVKKYGKFSYDGFSAAGFAYNAEKDIFYSTKNAWQKNFGYSHMYDVLAPIFQMIIDTEPVRFYYNNKNWLLTFWKGQYGIVTGAEIGIYCTEQQEVSKKTLYFPVNDSELLDMEVVLYKNEKIVMKARAKHWWLAIFKLGMFSKPKELSMDVNITFPNKDMLEAFLKSFKKLGYKPKNYNVIDNTFCFKYVKPRTRKVWTRIWIIDLIRQAINRNNVKLYNDYLGDLIENDRVDDGKIANDKKRIIVNDLLPNLIKNNEENQRYSKEIIEKLFHDENIVFLDNNSFKKRIDSV